MAETFDFAVVGKGLFGSAAARHLILAGHQVLLIGPDEPTDFQSHEGVFASHYDDFRIVRRTTRDPIWGNLAAETLRSFWQMEAESGIQFYRRRRGLHLVAGGRRSVFLDAVEGQIAQLSDQVTGLPDGNAIRTEFPTLRVADDARGLAEAGDAGLIEPRGLIKAQLALVAARGGHVLNHIVSNIIPEAGGYGIGTPNDGRFKARRVIVATGAYANMPGLLPYALDLRVKTEHVLSIRIDGMDADLVNDFPSLVIEDTIGPLSDFYVTPPFRTDDGALRMKMGCNTKYDRFLRDAGEMNAWMRAAMDPLVKNQMEAAFRTLFPDLAVRQTMGKKCLVTYTANVLPMIGEVAPGLFVATGGNGLGANASDAIGRLAARLACDNGLGLGQYHPGMSPTPLMAGAAGDARFSLRGMTRPSVILPRVK